MNLSQKTLLSALAVLVAAAAFAHDAQAGGQSPGGTYRLYTVVATVKAKDDHCIEIVLKKDTRYQVTVEHVEPEFYTAVPRPGFYDLKLRVQRFWKGDKKFDTGWKKGVTRVSYTVTGTNHGDRTYKICVFNAVDKSKKVQITVKTIR